ncbi:MAG: lysylphosphatidylglycerol synthase transmembrane domain-containing protein [Anaerolineales bacterium]
MRKLLVILLLFLAAALVILSFSEIRTLLSTLRQGNIWFLLMGILLEGIFLCLEGLVFWSIYHLLGLQDSPWRLILVALAANFVNIVAPSAGIGWVATWIDHGRRNNHPAAKITLAATLFLLFDYTAFLVILALGFVVLIRRQNLQWSEITAALILFGIALGLGMMLYLGYRSSKQMGALLCRLARWINALLRPFIHRDYLNEERAQAFAEEIGEGLKALPRKVDLLFTPLALALSTKLILIAILMTTFLAFNVPFSAGTLFGGFSIGYLFLIVSPTPSGVGFMEGAMALGLSSLRVDWSQAVLLTLVYRGITFWLPLGFGAWVFRRLHWQ